jgi:hypothetical protein
MGADQPLAEHAFRKRASFAFEQLADVALRDALTRGDRRDRQIILGQAFGNVRLDGAQPRGAHPTAFGDCRGVARRADRKRGEIIDLGDDKPAQLRHCQRLVVL